MFTDPEVIMLYQSCHMFEAKSVEFSIESKTTICIVVSDRIKEKQLIFPYNLYCRERKKIFCANLINIMAISCLLVPWILSHQAIKRRVIDHAENQVLAFLHGELQQPAPFRCRRYDIKSYNHTSAGKELMYFLCRRWQVYCVDCPEHCGTEWVVGLMSGIKPKVPVKVLNVAPMSRLNIRHRLSWINSQ